MPTVAAPARLSSRTAPLWPWLLLATVLVVFRSGIFVWHGTLGFDADQGVVGLMAKHIAEGRAFPVFQYQLPYTLMVSAWASVPFVWLLGATIAAIKMPLLLANVGVGVWLVRALHGVGLAPRVALVAALPVLLVAPIGSARLMDALGMGVEPFVFLAAVWVTRRHPLAFGIVAGIGFLVREFVAYGVAAVWLVDLLTRRESVQAHVRHWALVAVAFTGTKAGIDAVHRFGSPAGPGTWFTEQPADNLTTLTKAFCIAPQQAVDNVLTLGQSYLGALLGAAPLAVSEGAVQTQVTQGQAWLWPLLGLVLALVAVRLMGHWRVLWAQRHTAGVQLAAFLVLVGLQAVIVYAISRCGPIQVLTMRYAMFGIFLPVGLALACLLVEPARLVRRTLLTMLVLSAGVNAWAHATLWHEQVTRPHVTNRTALARELEARGLHVVRSDYWTAYYVSFMSQERVIVGTTEFPRIAEHERRVALHPGPVPTVSMTPCGSAPPLVPGYWLCEPTPPSP